MIVTTPEKWDVITRKGGEVRCAPGPPPTVHSRFVPLLAYCLTGWACGLILPKPSSPAAAAVILLVDAKPAVHYS
jgi:hypothetical protein